MSDNINFIYMYQTYGLYFRKSKRDSAALYKYYTTSPDVLGFVCELCQAPSQLLWDGDLNPKIRFFLYKYNTVYLPTRILKFLQLIYIFISSNIYFPHSFIIAHFSKIIFNRLRSNIFKIANVLTAKELEISSIYQRRSNALDEYHIIEYRIIVSRIL